MSDDSMIGLMIRPGDVIFVKQQDTVDNGDIAVASFNDEVRIGVYSRHNGFETLTPANDNYLTIFSNFGSPSFEIIGKAVALMSEISNAKEADV